MTPSKYIKSQGLPSTAFVADKVGKPVQTINNWYHNNFALFEVVVAGVKSREYTPRENERDAILFAAKGLLYERENDE